MTSTDTTWRRIAPGVLLPSALQAISYGAILPIIAVYAHDLGASLALAGLVAALILVGQLLGNLPGGWVVDRFGERNAMLAASGLNIAALAGCALTTRPEPLVVCALLIGVSNAVFGLSRQALITTVIAPSFRARAFSLMIGAYRLGFLIGPFVGAAAISATGSIRAGFGVGVAAILVTVVVILLIPDPSTLVEVPPAPVGTPRFGDRGGCCCRSGSPPRLSARCAPAATRCCRSGPPVSAWTPRRSRWSSGSARPSTSRCSTSAACSWIGTAGGALAS
jgi:MFS family permease